MEAEGKQLTVNQTIYTVLGINLVIAFFTFAAADHLSESRFTPTVVALCLLASAAPNGYLGTVMRLFKLDIGRYFHWMVGAYVLGAGLILLVDFFVQ